jgi:signal peptidase I
MINKQTNTEETRMLDKSKSTRASANERTRLDNQQRVEPNVDSEKEISGPPKSILREYFESLVVTVIMAMFGMTFVVQAVKVPTGSMQNTILVGDHLLINKFIFASGPHLPFLPQRDIRRGDIIVFKYPGNKNDPDGDTSANTIPFKTNYVKRVVGLPGEKVEIRGTQVFINDKPLPEHVIFSETDKTIKKSDKAPNKIVKETERKGNESYKVYWDIGEIHALKNNTREFLSREPTYGQAGNPFIIPKDNYFVLGDNRNNSQDSRYWGTVPRDLIIGRAMFVYWSYDESAESSGFFLEDIIRNTRWSRTGTMIK